VVEIVSMTDVIDYLVDLGITAVEFLFNVLASLTTVVMR